MLSLPKLALFLLVGLATRAAATTHTFQNGFGGYAGADNESYSFDGTVSHDRLRIDLPNASHPADSYAWLIFDDLFGPGSIPGGAANYGFLLLPETTNGGNLATPDASELTLHPRLVITYQGSVFTVPEPSALALLTLSLSAQLCTRRRG